MLSGISVRQPECCSLAQLSAETCRAQRIRDVRNNKEMAAAKDLTDYEPFSRDLTLTRAHCLKSLHLPYRDYAYEIPEPTITGINIALAFETSSRCLPIQTIHPTSSVRDTIFTAKPSRVLRQTRTLALKLDAVICV